MDANHPVKLKVYGTTRGARAYAIRDFLTRGDVPFEWVEVTGDDQAHAIGLENIADPRLPVCVFVDGSRVDCSTIRQIAEKLGWYRNPSHSEYDLAIYGAGPAGLSAAVYAASEGLRTVLIEKYIVGGEAEPARELKTI